MHTKAAEVRILPLSGSRSAVYVSNRGHNTIRTFVLDETTGFLAAKGYTATGELVWSVSELTVLVVLQLVAGPREHHMVWSLVAVCSAFAASLR
jgi:hypothetical protein